MIVADVRTRYLEFFKKRGHTIIPSAPIVPGNDPTTLFTSSGMQPLVPYLLGKDHPEGKRLANSQMSFRAGDIEEVGDNRHTTFFEMLGNWSLGDYFKKEQLPWVFEFLTSKEEGLGLDPNKLYVTVFAGDKETGMEADKESVDIWKGLFAGAGVSSEFVELDTEEHGYQNGMQGGRIFSYGARKNWWSRAGVPANMPAGEPGGPDSEVFYDFGLPHDEKWGKNCHPNCDCGRFVEIGNSVFMQYVKNPDGSFSELPKMNVDFGGGLERLTAATLGTPDVFEIDAFQTLFAEVKKTYGWEYATANDSMKRILRIIADHLRAAVFIAADGVHTSNTDAGYILRRLLRRAIFRGFKLAPGFSNLYPLANCYINFYQEAYPHLAAQRDAIHSIFEEEESRFGRTLEKGNKEFERLIASGKLSGEDIYILFTTHGFPFELIAEEAATRGVAIDVGDFERRMQEHQATSRAGAAQKFAGGLADHEEQTVRYHTTHHILLKALQMVLGDEVKQRGSNITAERLRIDFSSPGKMTDEQKADVERIVNDIIYQDLPVTRTVMPREEAEKLGAQMEFGVKYPDRVSVYSVGPADATEADPKISHAFSLEFCGGPHVSNTREIHEGGKKFKIQKEEAVAAGIRRIKAVLA